MQHFFVTTDQVKKPYIYIEGSDVNHMRNVLRMKQGEQVSVSDGDNHMFLCRVDSYEKDRAVLEILEEEASDTEPVSKIYLFQGLPKGDKPMSLLPPRRTGPSRLSRAFGPRLSKCRKGWTCWKARSSCLTMR